MPTCSQIVELFLSEEQWKEAPIHEYYDQDHVKLIKSDSEGDFDIEFEKEYVKLGFGFLSIKIPKEKFLIELSRELMNEICGEDVVSWAVKQDRKEREKGGKNHGS